MAKAEPAVPDSVRGEQHHSGTAARVFHRVQRARQSDHAEPEPAEIVPGQLEHERRDVHGTGETDPVQLHHLRRGPRPGAGDRHDHVAVRNPAHRALYIRRIRRVVERPDAQEEARADPAHRRRAGPGPGPVDLRVLFLRATDGGRRSRRVGALVADGRLDDHVHGRVHVHLRRNHGQHFVADNRQRVTRAPRTKSF